MKLYKLNDMVKGWFVGLFKPTVFKTDAVEVGVKKYLAGDAEQYHYHKIATEVTLILKGKVEMNGIVYYSGDIIVIPPNESTDFKALKDTINVVVKIPGALDDKYIGEIKDESYIP